MYGVVLTGVSHSVRSDQKNRWTTLTSLLVSRAGAGTLLQTARPNKHFRLCGLCQNLSQRLSSVLEARKEPQMIQNNEHGCAPIKLHLWTLVFDFIYGSRITRKSSPRPRHPRHLKMQKPLYVPDRQKRGGVGTGPRPGFPDAWCTWQKRVGATREVAARRPQMAPSGRRKGARAGPKLGPSRVRPDGAPRPLPTADLQPSLRSGWEPPPGVRVPSERRCLGLGKEPRGVRTPKGLSAPLIWGASRASAAKGVSTLSPSPVSMVTCSAPIQTAVLY